MAARSVARCSAALSGLLALKLATLQALEQGDHILCKLVGLRPQERYGYVERAIVCHFAVVP
jgi:hypothetical protein